jgi:prevent-host-death family protein
MESITSCQAKTHWSALLERTAKGEQFTITRRGVPVAMLVPTSGISRPDIRDVIQATIEFRKGHRLDGLSIREMIEEGRR